jgi:hypothetical protein
VEGISSEVSIFSQNGGRAFFRKATNAGILRFFGMETGPSFYYVFMEEEK